MTLREVLGEELYAQAEAKINEVNANQPDKTKHVKFADLSEGKYVSAEKHTSQIEALNQQITGLQGQITQRDTDIAGLNEKLTAAATDATKLTEAQNELTSLRTKYDTDKQEWDAKLKEQARESLVRERAGLIQFSSAAAKRDFIREANSKKFQMDGDTLLGYEDFMTKYKTENPGAIVEPKKDPPADPKKPDIVLPPNPKPDPDKSVFGFHFNGVRPNPADGK